MTHTEMLRINALGMKCPRPIVELAKARRRITEVTRLEIMADDLAFESDVRAWCQTTNSPLIDLKREGDVVTAIVEIVKYG